VAEASPAGGAGGDEKQRMTPGLEALLGVAEAHAKDNFEKQTAGDEGMFEPTNLSSKPGNRSRGEMPDPPPLTSLQLEYLHPASQP